MTSTPSTPTVAATAATVPPPSDSTTSSASYTPSSPTALQLGIAVLVLGSSAGFTLYTRKTGAMLRTMENITANQLRNRPPQYGPPNKAEWEKLKPRIDKDEFF
jgi:hypothetical protein